MSETVGKMVNGKPTDRFGKVVELLKQLAPRDRLNLLAGGLVATADELGLKTVQVLAVVQTAMAQRAAVLERMKQGERILFAPDGSPLVPMMGGSIAAESVIAAQEAPTVKLCRRCGAPYDSTGACSRRGEGCQGGVGEHPRTEPNAAQQGDPGPPCVFCGKSAADGRHTREAYPHTWHAYRPPVGDEKAPDPKELADVASSVNQGNTRA